MAYRVLEVTLLSAKDLKRVNLISRMEVYAVVTISGEPLTRQCTQPDPYGGRHPSWNTTFRFNIPPTVATATGCLHVLLRTERALGDRDVGEVIVPLVDILAGGGGACDPGPRPPQLASYQVRKVHRCEPRGMLNVSYRLGPIVAPQQQAAPPDEAGHFVGRPVPLPFYPPPLYGYPPLALPPPSLPMVPSPSVQAAGGHLPPPTAGHAAAHHLPPTKGKSDGKSLDFGMGLGAGLVSGAIGGMLAAGDIMSESDAAAYSYGYRAGLADGGAAAVYKNSRMPQQAHDKVEPNRAKIA